MSIEITARGETPPTVLANIWPGMGFHVSTGTEKISDETSENYGHPLEAATCRKLFETPVTFEMTLEVARRTAFRSGPGPIGLHDDVIRAGVVGLRSQSARLG